MRRAVYDYLIVGAGPAGLQLGYFLEQAGRRYLILEGSSAAGSFFASQPRHRKLLSFNKRHNWFHEADFELRYDWNSLLTYDSSIRFSDYTRALYPDAGDYVRYLNEFAARFELRIRHNARVVSIARERSAPRHFVVTDADGRRYRARRLMMATGATGAVVPRIPGIELAEGYEVHDPDPARFVNKRVLILGTGNAAFEVADHLAGHAAVVHVFTGGRPIRHVWQTHAVADLRAINNSFLEMAAIGMPHRVSAARVTRIDRHEDGALLVAYEDVDGEPHRALYDFVIRATGWKYFDPSLFAPDILPAADADSKYPVLSPIWESSVPDMFFIGAAMSGGDHHAGGLIHGFRHNIRALFHLLEERYAGVPLPARSFALETEEDLEILVEAVLSRISTTAALFHMFGSLGDALVFESGRADWYPELPLRHMLERPWLARHERLLTIGLELGFERFPKDADALSFIHPDDPGGRGCCVAAVHPVLRRYSRGKRAAEAHIESGVLLRYDAANEEFALNFDRLQPHHAVFNLINGIAGITREQLPTGGFTGGELRKFEAWEKGREAEPGSLPKCLSTHRREYVPDPKDYESTELPE